MRKTARKNFPKKKTFPLCEEALMERNALQINMTEIQKAAQDFAELKKKG
jgi:hypothetical protein